MPVIVDDDDLVVHDSSAIADHLEERYPDPSGVIWWRDWPRLLASCRSGPRPYCCGGSFASSSSTSTATARRRTRTISGARAKSGLVPPSNR
jgi:Glutathione S-transferase, N-terminal domain